MRLLMPAIAAKFLTSRQFQGRPAQHRWDQRIIASRQQAVNRISFT
jgi:hypothetical protein